MKASNLEGILSDGKLEKLLKRGDFVLTTETTPPDSTNPNAVLERVGCLNDLADAVNVLDAPKCSNPSFPSRRRLQSWLLRVWSQYYSLQ